MNEMTSANSHQRSSAPTQDWQPGEFVKSSFSGTNQGQCVEVATRPGHVALRNSNHAWGGPLVEYTTDEWTAFLRGVKAGEFEIS